MIHLRKPVIAGNRRVARRARLGRIVRNTLYVKVGLAFAVLVLACAFYLRLVAGPVSLQSYAGRVGEALAARIGPGWTVTISDTALELQGAKPAVRTAGLEVRNPAGIAVLRAPYAIVSLDPISLLTGSVSPREIELRDLQIRGMIGRDGSLSFEPHPSGSQAANGASPMAPPLAASSDVAPARDAAGDRSAPSPVSVAVASLLAPVVQATSLIGALDHATIVGARLTLIDADGRERAAFHRLAASFDRMDDGGRRIGLDLEGEGGAWRVRGKVSQAPELAADVEITGMPVTDVLLLTGLSRLPAGSDLRLSGRVSAAFEAGRVSRLEGRFESSAGSITRPGRLPLVIDRISGQASWNEAGRALRLAALDVSSQGTELKLAGDLAATDAGWQLKLSGQDAVLAGLARTDPAFTIGAVAAELRFAEGGITLDRASLAGEALDIEFSGSLVPGPAGPNVRGFVEARRTDVRRLVRVWPDALNPELRAYLAGRLGSGTVERLRLTSVLDPSDFSAVFSDAPLSDGALDLDFAVTGAELAVVDGLPPLRGLAIDGKASGTKASVQARSGRIEMPDGRALAFTEGSFVHANIDNPNSSAQVAFRISGGLDALASFLRSPIIRDAGGVDIDPATVRGRADLRASLPLVPKRIPALADMALSVNGTFTDVHADKLGGREKLEAGNFAVVYKAGALSIRGEGRLTGSPATIELQNRRGEPAEVTVALTLDDAARARRSLPSGALLAGPVQVKIAASLGSGSKAGARVEADLSRASIDGLVPGWVKPANKPGRVTFLLQNGDTPELRELAVDAGSVQIKGQLTLNASGGLDRADLGAFKLSPGDDMRVQIERGSGGAYRLMLRGNNADARPLLRWIAATPLKGATPREALDVEIDAGVNILTGHGDEAMTGVVAKASGRGSELRSLQFTGRFRNALVEATLGKRDAGAPVLAVRSGDAGATLRFLDLYRRMTGGKLVLDARSGGGSQEGRVTIDDFGLRGEPALRRIVSQASPQQQQSTAEDRGIAPIARSDLDQVLFNKLTADFRRSASRVEFTDAVIYGVQVGFNLAGFVDYGRDRLDVSGTFVPAYMLNNALNQLPVVGILLGGRNEGLFALDFRVAGSVASPALTVNPLTAVAPGILRKLFGWMMPERGEAPLTPAQNPQ